MDLILYKKDFRLIAEHRGDIDKLSELADGEYRVKITKPRNVDFHRKFFALVRLCYDNTPFDFPSQEHFLDYLKIKIGHCEVWITPEGGNVVKPKSISFGSMDNIAFKEFYSKALDFVLAHLRIDEQTLEKEIVRFI